MPANLQEGMHDREVVEWLQTDTTRSYEEVRGLEGRGCWLLLLLLLLLGWRLGLCLIVLLQWSAVRQASSTTPNHPQPPP